MGFGMMRLPVKSGDPTDFDYEQLNKMADAYLEAGYHYFDTSYVYHNGKSEEALRKAAVERYPRERPTIATKFPSFAFEREDQIEPIFEEQLRNLGVDYVDWESEMVQDRACYETARKHGKEVIIMEPVKGGGLARLPEAAERVLKEACPEQSISPGPSGFWPPWRA